MYSSKEIKFPERLFISGIDTDAGKSYATGRLAALIAESGHTVITQKFIQTGNTGFSEDIEVHRRLMGIDLTAEDRDFVTAPVIFSYPASPDLASRIDGRELDLSVVDRATDLLAGKYSHVLIEGAGGIMVPLKGDYLTIDYIRERNLPVVLVTNGRLGSINHTLLSLSAIEHAGIALFAVVYNSYFDKDEIICKDTRNYIRQWLGLHFPDSHYMEF